MNLQARHREYEIKALSATIAINLVDVRVIVLRLYRRYYRSIDFFQIITQSLDQFSRFQTACRPHLL